jgi:small-conductance mechanosensitive channel/CRP-like cAMP-binding protein
MFLVFSYFLFQAHLVPYVTAATPSDALARVVGDGLRTIWWFWSASIGSNLVLRFSFRGSRITGRRFFMDLCVAGIYLVAFVGFITFVLNFPVQGILVTSGAVAVVLGFALQNSLGDVFYGIVLNLGKPYRAGDWISLDNGVDGQVLEMNWRATHMLTLRQDVVIIPNSVVAKSKIVVSSAPSRAHGTTITVLLAPNTFPMTARRLIAEAIHGCPLALLVPPPAIVIKSMSADAIGADITFFTSGFSDSPEAQNQVYEKIFRRLGCAGIGLGSLTTALQPDSNLNGTANLGEAERLLAYTPMFSRLSAAERTAIAGSMTRETFETGKTVMEAAVKSDAMYVVCSGVLSCSSEVGDRQLEITRMSAADHFGAEGLLGERLTGVKVSALTTAILYRLARDDLMRIVEASPGFAAGLNRELAARRIFSHAAMEVQDVGGHSEESLAEWFSNLFRRPDAVAE